MFNVGSTCSTLSPSPGTRTGHTAGVNTAAISTGVISNIILAKCLYTLLCYRLCLNVVKYLDNHRSCAMCPASSLQGSVAGARHNLRSPAPAPALLCSAPPQIASNLVRGN